MTTRVKRTYNLPEETVRRVRELADEYGAARTQDGVIETAVERLYVSVRAEAEAASWEAAAADPAFQVEMAAIAHAFDDRDTWPA
jgi:predicted transcriptional regulator